MNCLTASAVPWNHFLPASPGVCVAAKTCLPNFRNPYALNFKPHLLSYMIREFKARFVRFWCILCVRVLGRDVYLHETISEVDTITMISPVNVTIKGGRIELGQYKYLVYSAVYAVAHRNINKPVTSSYRNLQKHRSSKHIVFTL